MTDNEIKNAKKREYFRTHPEQREKRNACTKKWIREHREWWNAYMRQYQYKKRMAKAMLEYSKNEKENIV